MCSWPQPAGAGGLHADFGGRVTFPRTKCSPTQGGSSECRGASACAGCSPRAHGQGKQGRTRALFLGRTLPLLDVSGEVREPHVKNSRQTRASTATTCVTVWSCPLRVPGADTEARPAQGLQAQQRVPAPARKQPPGVVVLSGVRAGTKTSDRATRPALSPVACSPAPLRGPRLHPSPAPLPHVPVPGCRGPGAATQVAGGQHRQQEARSSSPQNSCQKSGARETGQGQRGPFPTGVQTCPRPHELAAGPE